MPAPKHNKDEDAHWLDRRDRAKWSHLGRRPSQRERAREGLIKLWFGEDEGRNEIIAHQSGAKKLGDVLDQVMSSVGLGRMAMMDRLRDSWKELVGEDVAKFSEPTALYDRRLDIEVKNASWMYVLQTMHKQAIQKRVEEFTEGKVTEIRFVAVGRRPANNGR